MNKHYLDELVSGSERILLLQGPIGNFFSYLGQWLTRAGKTVFKLNFNAGDEYFYPLSRPNTFAYRETLADFPAYLAHFCDTNRIDNVVCFGDNRAYHKIAKAFCDARGLTFWAFEEGYFRPDYVTLERGGVNAFSEIPREAAFFREQDFRTPLGVPERLAKGFVPMARLAMRYYFEASFKRNAYPFYQHHREIDTAYYSQLWIKSGIKRLFYWLKDRRFAKRVLRGDFSPFFIVPLQVHNDSQVVVHSDFASVADFLADVLKSFAENAPAECKLIVKHHPMDRGFIDYQWVIDEACARFPTLVGRVFYVHDVPMPVFLRNGCGMVTINSTSGISALLHGMPTKTLGRANYDFAGLTAQQPLSEFWQKPEAPDDALFACFRHYHLTKTHLNGSFYTRVNLPRLKK